jgi:hypothetical protein
MGFDAYHALVPSPSAGAPVPMAAQFGESVLTSSARRSGICGRRQAEVKRRVGGELAGVRPAVELLRCRAAAARGDHPVGIDLDSDRV